MIKTQKILLFLAFFTFLSLRLNAQVEKYMIYFTDKDGVEVDTFNFLDSKAIERRIIHQLPILDFTDLPVRNDYIFQIKKNSEELKIASRWFNAVVSLNTPKQIENIKNFHFIKRIEKLGNYELELADLKKYLLEDEDEDDMEMLQLLINQTAVMGDQYFTQKDINGKGVRVAIFDAGFKGVDSNPVFEHIRANKRIIKTFDFVRNKEDVYGYSKHGTAVLSCVGGFHNGYKVGLATSSEFLLARTERILTEPFSEEENWLAAAEWADLNGAQIINSSLGYTHHRYFTSDMDGQKSLVTRAANMAAKKGILVVNSAGNSGSDKWKIMGAPADADSVLSVGGVVPNKHYHTSFSSFGPTADKRMKPNVTAYGHVYAASPSGMSKTQGTSFSSPLVAGFAACALQASPGIKNMDLFKAIEKSGHLYPYYDYAHGFGIPNAAFFTDDIAIKDELVKTFELKKESGIYKVIIDRDIFVELASKSENTSFIDTDYLFYHIQNNEGYLKSYAVIKVKEREVLKLHSHDFQEGDTLRIYYKGYLLNKTFD